MESKWVEDVFRVCCQVSPDLNSNGCKRDMPCQNTGGPSQFLKHFAEYTARVSKFGTVKKFFEKYLALPISDVFKTINLGAQNLSILDFFKRVTTPRDMKVKTSEKLACFLNELQISENGLIVYRNEWKWKKKISPYFLLRKGRAGKGKNEGKSYKMNNQLFILRKNMEHVIKAAFFYMQDHELFRYDFKKKTDTLQRELRQQLLRFLSVASVDLNTLVDSPWPHEVSTCDNNDNANSNSLFEPCKVEIQGKREAIIKVLHGNRILGRKVQKKHIRKRKQYYAFQWNPEHQPYINGTKPLKELEIWPGVGIYCSNIHFLVAQVDKEENLSFNIITLAKSENRQSSPRIVTKFKQKGKIQSTNLESRSKAARSRLSYSMKAVMMFVHLCPSIKSPDNTGAAWLDFYGEHYNTMYYWWTKACQIRGWLCFLKDLTWETIRKHTKSIERDARVFSQNLKGILTDTALSGGIPLDIIAPFEETVARFNKTKALLPTKCGSGHRSRENQHIRQDAKYTRTQKVEAKKYWAIDAYLHRCIENDIAQGTPKSRMHYEKYMVRFCIHRHTISESSCPDIDPNILREQAQVWDTNVAKSPHRTPGMCWRLPPYVSGWFTRFMLRNGIVIFI